MARNGKKSRIVEIGGKVSEWVSNLFAHPYMQIGVIAFCISWFVLKLDTNLLTAALSIMAITLTQMVLNRQTEREIDDRRRDVAMHAKLDELLIAMNGARDEMAGIEDLEEEEIVELKENIQDRFEVLNEELEERAEEKGARAAVAS
ncbi:low affinity iron permease family protein [Sphingomonas sp.]|uniref:low affinity iron permease family protein n=1 Tax=Sphingomonas sp. TaxID=28214 RepID=UPI0025EFCEDB|nr:low affinity iron permease family protein [Sphingomonas sp.]